VGFLRCATQREEVGNAMTLDQLRLSVDEMRARINDKIGDVLDDDLDCDRRIWNVSPRGKPFRV